MEEAAVLVVMVEAEVSEAVVIIVVVGCGGGFGYCLKIRWGGAGIGAGYGVRGGWWHAQGLVPAGAHRVIQVKAGGGRRGRGQKAGGAEKPKVQKVAVVVSYSGSSTQFSQFSTQFSTLSSAAKAVLVGHQYGTSARDSNCCTTGFGFELLQFSKPSSHIRKSKRFNL